MGKKPASSSHTPNQEFFAGKREGEGGWHRLNAVFGMHHGVGKPLWRTIGNDSAMLRMWNGPIKRRPAAISLMERRGESISILPFGPMLCLWLRRERDIWGGDQIYPEVPSGTPHPPNNVRGMHCIWHTFCGGALHSRLTYNFLPFVPIVDPQKKTQRMSPNALLFQMCTSFTYLGSQTVQKITVFVCSICII